MKPCLLQWLACPVCQSDLRIETPQEPAGGFDPDQDIESGLLVCESRHKFSISHGVPNLALAAELTGSNTDGLTNVLQEVSESFSAEWEHFDHDSSRTWHETVDDRCSLFLREVGLQADELKDMVVFDAGCGNGSLSNGVSKFGCDVLALDASDSVYAAQRYFSENGTGRVHFVKGDLHDIPVRRQSIDVVYSSGVLHHNPDTREAFLRVSKAMKPVGGRIYIWVYHQEPGIKFWLQLRLRAILRPLPMPLKNLFIHAWSVQSFARQHLRTLLRLNDEKDRLTYQGRVIDLRDIYTPRYRWMHSQEEVKSWYQEIALTDIRTTEVRDWGFGVLGVYPSDMAIAESAETAG